jgi:type IV secretory pathway VirB10-like protein
MQPIVLAGVALAFGIFVSPLTAQPMPPERPSTTAQPTGPNEPASPTMQSTPEAPDAQSLPEPPPPPPFPPMPRARPSHRFTTGGEHRTTHPQHRTTHARHATSESHHRVTRTHREAARAHHGKRHESKAAAKPSKRTIRYCHGLNYREIMRHSSCRALMSQELSASTHRSRRAAHKHRSAHHKKIAKARARHARRHHRS